MPDNVCVPEPAITKAIGPPMTPPNVAPPDGSSVSVLVPATLSITVPPLPFNEASAALWPARFSVPPGTRLSAVGANVGSAPADPSARVPAVIEVPPLKVFVPESVKVPLPVTVSPPVPPRPPEKTVPAAPVVRVPPKVTVPLPASEGMVSLSDRTRVPGLLTVTALLLLSALPPLITSVPPVTVVLPVKAFAPDRVTVALLMVSAPPPARAALMLPPDKLKEAAVRVAPEIEPELSVTAPTVCAVPRFRSPPAMVTAPVLSNTLLPVSVRVPELTVVPPL